MEKQIDEQIQEIIEGVDKHMEVFPMDNEEREQALVRDGIYKGKKSQKGMIKIEDVNKMIDEKFDESKFKTYCSFIGWIRQDIKELKQQLKEQQLKKL